MLWRFPVACLRYFLSRQQKTWGWGRGDEERGEERTGGEIEKKRNRVEEDGEEEEEEGKV